MEQDAREVLGVVSTGVAEALSRFLEVRLSALDPVDWWEKRVSGRLGPEQRRRLFREGISTLSELDLLALLRVLKVNGADFDDPSSRDLASSEQVERVQEVRNAIVYADVHPISEDEKSRHLQTLARFLEMLDSCGFPARIPGLADRLSVADASQVAEPGGDAVLELNGFTIHPSTGIETRENLVTLSGAKSDARIAIWPVSGPSGERFLVHDIAFENGERHVCCGSRCDSPEKWDRLVGRLRQGVYAIGDGRCRMDLRQARLKENGWSNRFQATRRELEEGAGLDVFDLLEAVDGVRCGLRGEVLGEGGRTRNQAAVVFPEEERRIPVAAYVLTTFLPLERGMKASV